MKLFLHLVGVIVTAVAQPLLSGAYPSHFRSRATAPTVRNLATAPTVRNLATAPTVRNPATAPTIRNLATAPTVTSSILQRGSFLNIDEIDDLFRLSSESIAGRRSRTVSRHIPLATNSTWFSESRARSGQATPTALHLLERKDQGNNYEVVIGNFKDDSGAILGENIIVRRKSDGFVFNNNVIGGVGQRIFGHRNATEHSMLSGATGHYHPTDDYAVDEELEEDRAAIRRLLHESVQRSSGYMGQPAYDEDGDAERDPDGNISIDLLCGMNPDGLEYAGDIESLCTAEVEGINLALSNSGIPDVRIRLVGAILVEEAGGWNTMEHISLHNAKELMKPLRDTYGADLLNLWLRVPGSDTRGRAYIDGYVSIMEVHALSTLRHEVGHNAGLRHCPVDDKDHTHWVGWLQPETKRGTIMCGQDISMYSNDYMSDGGHSVGDASVANSVLGWRTNAAKMSKYRPAVLPYDWENKVEVLRDTVEWKDHKASRTAKFVVPEGAKRATVMIASQLEQLKDYPTLYVKKDSEPSANDYDYRSVLDGSHGTRNNAYVHMKPVAAGTYYVVPESYRDHDHIVWDVVAWVFGDSGYGESGESGSGGSSSGSGSGSGGSSSGSGSGGSSSGSGSGGSSSGSGSGGSSSGAPEWSSSETYGEACMKVSYEGDVWLNGWYTKGTAPGSDGPWGVWRKEGDSNMHTGC